MYSCPRDTIFAEDQGTWLIVSFYLMQFNHVTLFLAPILTIIFCKIFYNHLYQEYEGINLKWQLSFPTVIYFYLFLYSKRGDTFSQIGRRRNFNIFSRWYLLRYCTWRDFCTDYFIKMSFTLWNASVWQLWTPYFVEQALTQRKYQEYTCDWPLNKPCLLSEFGSLCAWAALKGVFFFPYYKLSYK